MRQPPETLARRPPAEALADPQARPAQARFPDQARGARRAAEAGRHPRRQHAAPPPGTLPQLLDVRDEGLVPGPLRLSQGGRSLLLGRLEPSPRPRAGAQDGPGG